MIIEPDDSKTRPRRFQKRPVEIEAMQFSGATYNDVVGWLTDDPGDPGYEVGWDPDLGLFLTQVTLEGKMTARDGDWIIRGVKGEFYPVRRDIFESTYEECL